MCHDVDRCRLLAGSLIDQASAHIRDHDTLEANKLLIRANAAIQKGEDLLTDAILRRLVDTQDSRLLQDLLFRRTRRTRGKTQPPGSTDTP